jgi:hypothetical protein
VQIERQLFWPRSAKLNNERPALGAVIICELFTFRCVCGRAISQQLASGHGFEIYVLIWHVFILVLCGTVIVLGRGLFSLKGRRIGV